MVFRNEANNEKFTTGGSCCLQNLKYGNSVSRRHLADYVEQFHQKACHSRSTIIFPHSTNHIIDFWCALRCFCRRFLNSLKPFSSHLRLINLGVAGKLNLQEFSDSLTTFIQYGWNNGSFDVRYDVAAQPVLARNTSG